MTSRWRHYCFGGLDLSEAPLQENVAIATAKDPHSNFYLLTNSHIFSGKSPNLVELSFSLSELWAKNPKGGAEYPPPPPPGQDRVKVSGISKSTLQVNDIILLGLALIS